MGSRQGQRRESNEKLQLGDKRDLSRKDKGYGDILESCVKGVKGALELWDTNTSSVNMSSDTNMNL